MTREAVLDAAVDAIRDRGLEFSVQDAADRAGVSHRTVYRYFETRDALIDAVAERYEDWLVERGIRPFGPVDAAVAQIDQLFGLFDEMPDLVRAVALYTLAGGERTRPSRQRTERWRADFAAELPHLSREEIEPLFAVCRTLAGSIGWHLLTSHFDLSAQRASEGIGQALAAIVADLRRRNDEAAERAATRRGT
ncbi:hypothetical protein BH23CHL7_BH23CHL7_06890 [soil metagenome]